MTDPGKKSNLRPADRKALVFGVSGHRDLVSGDLPLLRSQLKVVFSRFQAAHPDIPCELLSPLAEGADRLAAEVALALQIKLLVPMPMTQEEYERDFSDPASLNEFRRLLGEAQSHWVIASGGQTRTDEYAAVGDYIARESHVLILFWDGYDNKKVGGTAWVKKRREYWVAAAAAAAPSQVTDGLRYGPTIQIVTPRLGVAYMAQDRPRLEIIGDLPPDTTTR